MVEKEAACHGNTPASLPIDGIASEAARAWNLSVRQIRRDLLIAGSPDRCELRMVIECDRGSLYVIESLMEADCGHKLEIIRSLNVLKQQGMPGILSYLRAQDGSYIVTSADRLWQVAPYVAGQALVRPEYVAEGWRGDAMADFLIRLRTLSGNIPELTTGSVFSITGYIQKLLSQIRKHDPEVLDGLRPVIHFIENRFTSNHDRLPVSFCHGDFHPMNIIWSMDGIHAVIDWEFLGIKPEIYDVANLIGCIGMEDPSGLCGNLVRQFVCRLKQSKWFSESSWEILIEFVIAIRFAWLSEWLRHRDTEMIALETVYMNLLVEHAEVLRNRLITAAGCR